MRAYKQVDRWLIGACVGLTGMAMVLGATMKPAAAFSQQDLAGTWRVTATTYAKFPDGTLSGVSASVCTVKIAPRGRLSGRCGFQNVTQRVQGALRVDADGIGNGRFKVRGSPLCNRVDLSANANTLTGVFACRRDSGFGTLVGVRLR